jgi:glucose/mannose-6-phosphate isomerase
MQMDQLIAEFPAQLRRAIAISEAHAVPRTFEPKNIAIFGMGGSAFGGELFANITENSIAVPVSIHRSYEIPAYIGPDTLCIICSYSGNTEETLSAAEQAKNKKATVIAVASGGQLQQFAQLNNYPFILIPSGQPPRTAFGYTFVQLLHIAHTFGLIPDYYNRLNRTIELLEHYSSSIRKQAEKTALDSVKRIPIIYSDENMQAVALRWRQQIAENAKILCWHHTLPEMNHNELVGWGKEHPLHEQSVVYLLRSKSGIHPRTELHYRFLEEYLATKQTKIIEIIAETGDIFSDMFYLIHYGDWLSYYMALRNEVDPIEVQVINRLKNFLSEKA